MSVDLEEEVSLRCKQDESCEPGELFGCDYVFGDPVCRPVREGGTMVQWTLDPRVRDTGEYHYTLQTGNAGTDDRAAWRNVAEGTDTCFLIDPKRRLPGAVSYTHYRLRLRTGERIYYSRPLHTMGNLTYEDWRIYLGVIRAEHVQLVSKTGIPGVLHKRRISGNPCRRCRDHNTREVKDDHCPVCLGTGWVRGYYKPIPCFYLDVSPGDASIRYDINGQGPAAGTVFQARGIAVPLLITGDVWMNSLSTERFRIIQVVPVAEQKGVPAVYQLLIERLPFSDVAYTLPKDA
jgi:hypothetical protein